MDKFICLLLYYIIMRLIKSVMRTGIISIDILILGTQAILNIYLSTYISIYLSIYIQSNNLDIKNYLITYHCDECMCECICVYTYSESTMCVPSLCQ